MKASHIVLACFVFITIAGCGDDSVAPVHVNKPRPLIGQAFRDFEAAFNQRSIGKYNRIIDEGFVFHCSQYDQVNGIPPRWDRAVEIDLMTKLLDPENQSVMQCDSIHFDFNYSRYLSFTNFHPDSAPDETWYRAQLVYDFAFRFETGLMALTDEQRAEFTIRNAGTEDAPVWKFVTMREIRAPGGSTPAATIGTPPWSLGAVKALYLPPE